jgi:hypothetical protein
MAKTAAASSDVVVIDITDLTPTVVKSWKLDVLPVSKRGKGSYVSIYSPGTSTSPRIRIEGVRFASEPCIQYPPNVDYVETRLRIQQTRALRDAGHALTHLPRAVLAVSDKEDPIALEDSIQWSRTSIEIGTSLTVSNRKQHNNVVILRFPSAYERIRNISLDYYYTLDVELIGIHLGMRMLEWRLLMLRITDSIPAPLSIKDADVSALTNVPTYKGQKHVNVDDNDNDNDDDDYDREEEADFQMDPEDKIVAIARLYQEISESQGRIQEVIKETRTKLHEYVGIEEELNALLKSLKNEGTYVNSLRVYDEWLRLSHLQDKF